MPTEINNNIRFNVSLPPWYDIDLELWAWVKGTNRASLASNILQARIEANKLLVKEQLEEIARDNEITLEELRTLILEKKGKAEFEESA